jgi:hypothetical protein
MFSIIWIVSGVLLLVMFLKRRYKAPRYTTQKFSRSCKYLVKTDIMTLKVPWHVQVLDYTPQGSTADSFTWWWFDTTYIDGKKKFLIEVSPVTFSRVPINPMGRTGYSGMGLFPKYGPTHMIMTLVYSKTFGFLRAVYTKRGDLIYQGYIDHPMNTDNAWYEAEVYSVITDESPIENDQEEDWVLSLAQRMSGPP